MPTLDEHDPETGDHVGLLATHHGGKEPFSERFRRAKLRQSMFGDAGERLSIGRYTITGKIGEGAMGAVYRATDASLDREVAIKILHRRDETHRARMQIEAKALAKLSHPNVVTVHEVGTEDDQLFVAMEYVPGRTLERWLEAPSGPDVVEIFVQAARGLQAAHDAGVVHRDFKPENMIVGDDGRVRVLDFGMARSPGATLTDEVDDDDTQLDAREPAITRTGILAGTPGYMAPEQFAGSRVDARADQFAFCVALHEAVWGSRPFRGNTLGELARSVTVGQATLFSEPPRIALPSHQLQAVRAVIERGLAVEPTDRFASMTALQDQLRCLPAPTSAPPRRRGHQALWAAALVSGVFVGVGAYLLVLRPAEPDPLPSRVVLPALSCEPGTYEDGDRCSPIEWDPSLLECTTDGCTMPRWMFRKQGDQPAMLLRQARFVPSLNDDNQITGYKIYGVRPRSALALLGFQPGDLVTSINGISLAAGVDAVLPALDRLDSTASLRVRFERGGEEHTRTIGLTD